MGVCDGARDVRKNIRRALVVVLCLAVVSGPMVAQAQVVQLAKPFTGVVNKAVATTLSRRLTTMGFAANDPIYTATMAGAETVVGGAVAAGSVAATIAAIGTAPVWLSVALGIGAAYEVYDFTMGSNMWKADAGSYSVTVAPAGTYVQSVPPPDLASSFELSFPPALPVDYGNPGVGKAIAYPSDLPICATYTTNNITSPIGAVDTTLVGYKSATICGMTAESVRDQAFNQMMYLAVRAYNVEDVSYIYSLFAVNHVGASGPTKIVCTINAYTCPQGFQYAYSEFKSFDAQKYTKSTGTTVHTYFNNAAFNYSIFNNPAYLDPARRYTANDAAAKLQETDLAMRADPELLAAIANKIWQQAAQQPGYIGAPYDAANPVTAADILADVAAGLYPHPTNYDLLSLPAPDLQTAPALDPNAAPVSQPAGDSQTVTVDFGPDPAVGAPTLEDAPTGSAVVSSVMGLLPSLTSFAVPGHTTECVAPSFTFFGGEQSMQSMCDLLEQQRALLSAIFAAMWAVAGLTVVLRA